VRVLFVWPANPCEIIIHDALLYFFFCVCVTLNLFCVRHAWLCVSASRGIAFQSIARAAISWYYIQNSRDCSSSNNVNAKTDWKYNQNWRLQRSAARVGGLKFFDDFRIIHCATCVWHLFKQHPSRLAPGCFLSINSIFQPCDQRAKVNVCRTWDSPYSI